MALYAMGNFHLSFGTDKPMDVFGKEWKNHEKKIEKHSGCRILLNRQKQRVIGNISCFKGYVNGIEYKLVSGDYLGFKPERVL